MSPPSSRHEPLPPQLSPRSSTRRRPLRERSPSLTNATGTHPTIRVVDDPGADNVYTKSPFPSEAAHLLPPRHSTAAFEDQGCKVSGPNPTATAPARMLPGGSVADRIASFESIQSTTTLAPKLPQLHRSQRESTASTRTSNADTFVDTPFTPSSSRFSQSTTPPSSPSPPPPPEESEKRDSLGSLAVLQEGKPLQTAPTIRPVIPSSSIAEPRDPPERKLFGSSISSSSSSATPTLRNPDEDRQGSSSLASNPPHPSSSHHTRSSSWHSTRGAQSTQKVPAELSQSQSRQTPSSSDDSLADLSVIPPSSRSSERPRSATSPVHPTHAARTITLEDGSTLQYPLVRPPSASGSWVESRVLPKHPSRMTERSSNGHKWSSALSTIESTTEPRTSQSLGSTSVLNLEDARRRQTLSSFVSSNIAEGPSSSEVSVTIPRPLFSPQVGRSPTAGGDSGEHGDTVGDLYSPPLRQQRSGNFRRWSVESSRPATAASNRSSYTANVTNTLPEWTRVYYRRSDRASFPGSSTRSPSIYSGPSNPTYQTHGGAPASSTETSTSRSSSVRSDDQSRSPTEASFPLGIYRPRTRPHTQIRGQGSAPTTANRSSQDGDSLLITEAPLPAPSPEKDLYAVPPPVPPKEAVRKAPEEILEEHPKENPFGAPRLRPDKRNINRASIWTVPSISDPLEHFFFNKNNRQILLFCIGFVFPLLWILAAILPLPARPDIDIATGSTEPLSHGDNADTERALVLEEALYREKTYQKARWWRALNRAMSVFGLLVIGTVIALAVVAPR